MFHSVFELWKEVKDKLSLPLLVCLCERAGLPPPASLLIIPTELKVKVLELLPAIALARSGCVCSELKFLAGSDDLWKIRFKEEFGGAVLDRTSGLQGWKNAFAREWSHRRRQEQERREADRHMRVPVFGVRIRPRPYVPHFPGVIGGDYDIFPGMGGGVGGGFRPRVWDATL
jgi:F-box protein 7